MRRTLRQSLIVGGLIASVAGTAGAATIVDTGVGTAAPLSAVVGPTLATFGQFQVTQEVLLRSVEFYGTVATSGAATFGISANENNVPSFFLFSEGTMLSATQSPGWYGAVNLNGGDGYTLLPGTYWVSFYNAGEALVAQQYGSSTDPLGRDLLFTAVPVASFQTADSLNLAWRLSGDLVQSGVPELSTWLMMLIGFGAIGFVMRRKPTDARAFQEASTN